MANSSTKDCLARIDKLVEDALKKDSSISDIRKTEESTEMKNFTRTSAASTILDGTEDSATKIRSTASTLTDVDNLLKKSGVYRGNVVSEQYNNSESTNLDWVNYNFTRLVTDKKNSRTKLVDEANNNVDVTSSVQKNKSYEQVLKDYNYNVEPTSGAISSSGDPFRNEVMNRSYNNETFDSLRCDTDQLKKIGSSVDGDSGDVMRCYGAKCSSSGTRCRTPVLVSSTSHQLYDENKTLKRVASGSDVDCRPCTPPGKVEANDIRTEMANINYSFQKERERLRNLESLIKKTPLSSTSLPSTDYYRTMKSNNFSSKYMSQLSGRKAYSSTDYTTIVKPEWRAHSPTRELLGHSYSSGSFRNLGITSSSSRTKAWMDHTSSAYPSYPDTAVQGYSSCCASRSGSNHQTTEFSKITSPKLSRSGVKSLSKTALNTTFNNKRDKNMSKSQTFCRSSTHKNGMSKHKGFKSSVDNSCHSHNRQDGIKVNENYYSNSDAYSNNRNTQWFSGTHPAQKDINRTSQRHIKNAKYQPYQPKILPSNNQFLPKKTKSETSSVFSCTTQRNFDHLFDREPFLGGQYNMASDFYQPTLNSVKTDYNTSETENCVIDPIQRKTKGNKRSKSLRSKSECRGLNTRRVLSQPSYSSLQKGKENDSSLHSKSSQAKKSECKPKPAMKKKISSCPKRKKTLKK